MITKQQLDEHFNEDYDRLFEIINGMAKKYRSTLDASYVISLAYENALNKLDKIEENKIPNFITGFARLTLRFKNNPANNLTTYNYRHDYITNMSDFDLDEEDDLDLAILSYLNDDFNEDDSIDPFIYLDEFKDSLNVFDKILAEQLEHYITDKKQLDLCIIYNCSKKDSMSYKKRLNHLYLEYLEYCKNKIENNGYGYGYGYEYE